MRLAWRKAQKSLAAVRVTWVFSGSINTVWWLLPEGSLDGGVEFG